MRAEITNSFDTAALEDSLSERNDATEEHETLQVEWLNCFTSSAVPADKLQDIKIPPRELVVGEWFKEGDLGFIFAPRGMGKTWMAMLLAIRISEGGSVADWKVHRPRRVLYVDGEMAFDSTRERHEALSVTGGQIGYLHHENVFHTTGKVLNLTDTTVQRALFDYCIQEKTEILFLDNLSCLFSGMKENDADSWEMVLPWLLELRRAKIAVVFIHHAGRNGAMRGTSRREDAALWVMQLSESKNDISEKAGARFVTRFIKNRNSTENAAPAMEWNFTKAENGRTEVSWAGISNAEILCQWVENGLTSATDIAIEMGISKGQVSKLAKQGIAVGRIEKNGREYAPAK